MCNQLDEEIFFEFVKKIKDKKILSLENLAELEGFINNTKVTSEDWDLLVDKECFPKKEGSENGR